MRRQTLAGLLQLIQGDTIPIDGKPALRALVPVVVKVYENEETGSQSLLIELPLQQQEKNK